jgi:hypothetical protein
MAVMYSCLKTRRNPMAKKKKPIKEVVKSDEMKTLREQHEKLILSLEEANDNLALSSNIRLMTHYHLSECLERTGSILQEDLDYCKKLSQRIIEYSEK